MTDYAILYAFHQSNVSGIILDNFIKNGLSDKATYYFLLCGPDDTIEQLSNKYDNIHIRYYEGTNTAWQKWALIIDEIQYKYKYYIFVKDKMMGPFLTDDKKKIKKKDNNWMSLLVEPLSDKNIVIAPIINPLSSIHKNTCRPHLQVNFWATHNIGLKFLLSHNFFRFEIRKREYYLLELLTKYDVKGICYYKPLRNLDYIDIRDDFYNKCLDRTGVKCRLRKESDIFKIPPEELMFVNHKNIYLDDYFDRIRDPETGKIINEPK